MIKITHAFHAKGSVIALYENEKKLCFTDNKGYLYIVSKEAWSMDTYYIESEDIKPLHPYQKSSCFDSEGTLIYSVDIDGSCALKVKTPSPIGGKTLQTVTKAKPLNSHKALVYGNDQRAENIAFAGEKNEYLFTGGTDGRVFMYNSLNGDIISSFKPLPDFIAHINSNKTGRYLTYSSYNGSLHVFDLRFYEQLLHLYPGDVIEDTFFFNREENLYAIGRDGVSYIYDLQEKKLLTKKALFPSWPTCCVLEKSGRYGIVGTRSGHLHLVKLNDNSISHSEKLDQKGIVSLAINDSTLMIGFENGTMYYVDMYAYSDQFVNSLSNKDFALSKNCLDRNLFLAIHPMSDLFYDAWDDIIKEIREQFSKGNTSCALVSATPFLDEASHKQQFDFLVQKQKELEKFAQLVDANMFFEAYGLLEASSYLSKTENYVKLERGFNKVFATAKKIIADDPLRNFPKAQEMLKPFMAVSSKAELIRSLMKNYQIFLKADQLIKTKDFKRYFAFCEEYSFLKEEDVYRKVCDIAEGAIKKIFHMIEEHHYDEAISGIRQLVPFTPYKLELSKLLEKIQIQKRLISLIDANKIKEVYDLVKIHPILGKVDRFVEYEKQFDEYFADVMALVGKGEIKQTQQSLSKFLGIAKFKSKVKECLRQASYNRLSTLLLHGKMDSALPIVAFYLKEFGRDYDFEKLSKRYRLGY